MTAILIYYIYYYIFILFIYMYGPARLVFVISKTKLEFIYIHIICRVFYKFRVIISQAYKYLVCKIPLLACALGLKPLGQARATIGYLVYK